MSNAPVATSTPAAADRRPRKGLCGNTFSCCRRLAGFLLRRTGLFWALRRITCRRRATILVYHDPSPEAFERHLAFLASHFTFVPLGQLVDAIRNRDWSRMPAYPLAITIDDGHQGNYRLLDAIRRWNVRPTIYLCSEIIATQRHFWWKNGCSKNQDMKTLPREEFLDVLHHETGYEPEKEYADRQSLNSDELRALSPYVDFGSHTQFHPILTNCPDDVCRREIAQSKRQLEELLGCSIEHFSYPNGDYTDRETRFVAQAHYRSARTIEIGRNGLNDDPMKLLAIPVDDDASTDILCGEISGVFGRIHTWLHRTPKCEQESVASQSSRTSLGTVAESAGRTTPIRVLMLGMEPRNGGGMGTVVQHLLDYDFVNANVQLRFVPNDHGASVPRKLLYFLQSVIGTVAGGLRRNVDVLHIHTCSGKSFIRASVCIGIARVFRIPVVIHIHGGGFPLYLRRFRALKLAFLNRCASILVVNDHLLDMLDDERLRDRVKVLYNMLPEPLPGRRHSRSDVQTSSSVHILYLGRFDALKGCMELLEAFRTVHKKHPNAILTMAGNGNNWQAARRFVADNQLSQSVALPGWIEGDRKEQLLDAADILVLPSFCEAFPMVILEAMQRAIPVVTAARPGAETQVVDHETGIIAKSAAPEHLAAALLELIDDPSLRNRYGAAGRQLFLQRFTSDVIGPQLVDIYCSCINQNALSHDPLQEKSIDFLPGGASTCGNS